MVSNAKVSTYLVNINFGLLDSLNWAQLHNTHFLAQFIPQSPLRPCVYSASTHPSPFTIFTALLASLLCCLSIHNTSLFAMHLDTLAPTVCVHCVWGFGGNIQRSNSFIFFGKHLLPSTKHTDFKYWRCEVGHNLLGFFFFLAKSKGVFNRQLVMTLCTVFMSPSHNKAKSK